MSSLEPYRHSPPYRPTARELSAINRRVDLAHARSRAEAEIAAGRISDIAHAARHGLAAATLIAMETESAVQMAPWAQQDLMRVARTGMGGIANVIADLADPFA